MARNHGPACRESMAFLARNTHMREIRELRGPLGLPVERDLHFDANKTLSAYAEDARAQGRIVA